MNCGDNQGGSPNYFPNTFNGQRVDPRGGILKYKTVGDVARYDDFQPFFYEFLERHKQFSM